MIPKELSDILVFNPIDSNKYYDMPQTKAQIYLHHTVSGAGIRGDLNHWLSLSGHIATAFIIGEDKIYQLFSSKYWAHHLGIKTHIFNKFDLHSINTYLNKHSVAIEIDSWGQIYKEADTYYNVYGGKVKVEEVCKLTTPYKTYASTPFLIEKKVVGQACAYYHKYTEKQLEMTKILLEYLGNTYDIDLSYNEDIWDLSERALQGENGVFTHNSVRPDKTDVFPYPPLIEMLKSLC